jgi:hypothetical protein
VGPFKDDELSEQELDALLPEWKAPRPPVHMRASIFPAMSRRRWRDAWRFSVRIPLPVAVAAGLVLVLAISRRSFVAEPRVIVRTERVEVPVYKDRAVPTIVYRDRIVRAAPAPQGPDSHRLLPVSELRPIIIRSGE